MSINEMRERFVEVARLLPDQGLRTFGRRVVRRMYQRSGAASLEFPLLLGDVADSADLRLATPDSRPVRGQALTVGWVCTPPSAGSGGHTTMFRMVEALEQAGHNCVLYLYDRFGGRITRHAEVVRRAWPNVAADVRDAVAAIDDVDVCIATSWQSAHVLAARSDVMTRRCYFIQDFEPFFFPRGSEYALAADSYRFGFRNIALGSMVADHLRDEIGVDSDVVPFGCDSSTYSLTNTGGRTGIVFYAKPDVARRGYKIALLALEEFYRRCGDQEIHIYGENVRDASFPFTYHGRLAPEELNRLYNRAIAGIAMSFTNISLVAEEMLASGCIPVVNDDRDARADLPNQHVRWAIPTPHGIADALCNLVEHEDYSQRAARAANSVRINGWAATASTFVGIIEREAYGQDSAHINGTEAACGAATGRNEGQS